MSKFIEYLRSRIGSIYVWGAQGSGANLIITIDEPIQ